ncbi:uncharacterized protein LOC133803522 isoform X2 [Humulus lupulus]|nr:uncharacterized protein LOC133803522 isoform X2 [Humulus lupulus]XP_062097587.1 uncharacterized protein LOC133803522 isoform X2 [Humulus lupulus]XP_062097588.1 uncharacterized protein LOC133803522 isoform X2 [Humulus lupulus]
MSESVLENLLKWLPFWPYAKGIITVFLVLQCFAGACYIYHHFIRSTFLGNSLIWKFEEKREEPESLVHVVEENVSNGELHKPDRFIAEWKKPVLNYTSPVIPNIQKEWCCALCLISTSNENNLIQHFNGRKHRAKEEDLLLYKQAKRNGKSSIMIEKTCVIENLNHIAVKLLNPVARPIFCTWKKPNCGWTKLNTDGSLDRTSAGIGGLLRDHHGHPLCAFVSKAPGDDVFSVELWAIWRGLVLASGLGIKVIWVESDSMSAVNTINRHQSCSSQKAIPCLNHIWVLLKKFDKYKISHSWRETNTAADYLAKMNLMGNDVVFGSVNFPEKLHNIINNDAQGRIYVRNNW